MSTAQAQELCEEMLHSKAWQMKETLFFEAFPDADDRVRFFCDFGQRLLAEQAGDEADLNYLYVRKLAIEHCFERIPKSRTKQLKFDELRKEG